MDGTFGCWKTLRGARAFLQRALGEERRDKLALASKHKRFSGRVGWSAPTLSSRSQINTGLVAVMLKLVHCPSLCLSPLLRATLRNEATKLVKEIFVLTTGPIERLGRIERFLQYVAAGFQRQGYGVRIFHVENSVPKRWRHPKRKIERLLADGLHGFYIGRAV